MTKEEAIEYYTKTIEGLRIAFHIPNVIAKIYDDFKNRTCINCKYDNLNYKGCKAKVKRPLIKVKENNVDFLTTDKTFGCNKFEEKETNNGKNRNTDENRQASIKEA